MAPRPPQADFRPHRFSSWDGSQDPLGPDVDELFSRLSEDVFHGWDFEDALRRLLAQGWRDRRGRRMAGFEEMLEQLRRRRKQQLERYNLDSIFDDIKERLDRVVSAERRGIDERLERAGADTAKRVMERVASSRRKALDELPDDPAGAIRGLQSYEFVDAGAEQQFRELLDEMRKRVVDTHFSQLSQRLKGMSKEDMSTVRELAHDLNALLRQRLEGVPPEQLQANYESFLRKWGHMFPNAPQSFDEFVEQLQRQMAQMDSLLQSLSPEMRRELGDMMSSLFQDPELQAELSQLAGALELLSPRPRLGSRYSFMGGEELSFGEAMDVMERLQSMEELERSLRGAYQGAEVDAETRERLSELLGPEAGQSLDQLQQVMRLLEQKGLVQRDGRGLQLTARGMRRIGQKALSDLFARLKRDRFGSHTLQHEGAGGERSDDTKPYEFGDPFELDVEATIMNALRREAAEGGLRRVVVDGRMRSLPRLAPDDFEVQRSQATTRSSTVLMLDMSRSMPLRGYFYAAKKVALALDSLIRTQFPRDTLHIVGFSEMARLIPPAALPQLTFQEYVYGTNMQHGLMLARHLLGRQPGSNKQIIIISDGEPTAHMEGGRPVFFYPPLPETFHKTLLEVQRCTKDGIVINTFMLESNYHLVQFVKQMTRLNRGRAFFIAPDRLGDYILVDYVSQRRGRSVA
ncbi:MAG TPA: VWA domain-containing protein [Candidatus Dormibacteraeota bacterium]|nr:VWA domain-containing protein [Candidatus Dormibacteraeota bacterium]